MNCVINRKGVKCSMFYCIKIKTTTDLYRFIRLSFDKITDVRNMQIFDKVYQTGVSGDLHCCTYLVDTDMLRCLISVKKNCLKSHLFSFHIGTMSTLNGFV